MIDELKEKLAYFLWKNIDVFPWTHEDMLGIDPSVMVQQLNVDPLTKLVKQKQQNFALERNQTTMEEVDKLLRAGFIREV